MAFGDLMMSKFWMGINMHGVKYAPRLQRNQGCSLGFAQKTLFVLAAGLGRWARCLARSSCRFSSFCVGGLVCKDLTMAWVFVPRLGL